MFGFDFCSRSQFKNCLASFWQFLYSWASISMARIWEARSLWCYSGWLFYHRKLFKSPIRSSFLSLLWLLWIPTRYWILVLLSSKIPSMSIKAKVTSFGSPLTFLTISKNNLMYSSALFLSEMACLYWSSLRLMNSVNLALDPWGNIWDDSYCWIDGL